MPAGRPDPDDLTAQLLTSMLGPRPAGAGNADRRTQRAEAKRNARLAARASGCTCHPTITYRPNGDGPGIPSIAVAHDHWCPLANAGHQYLLAWPPSPHPRKRDDR